MKNRKRNTSMKKIVLTGNFLQNDKQSNPWLVFNEELEKKYAPTLDNYGQSCFVRIYFLKMKCVCKTQMMPSSDHKKEMKSHSLSFCEYLTKIPPPLPQRLFIARALKI
jgi:hypothetical protein